MKIGGWYAKCVGLEEGDARRVVIVHQRWAVREGMAGVLRRVGYDAVAANSSDELVALAAGHPSVLLIGDELEFAPDCVLVDAGLEVPPTVVLAVRPRQVRARCVPRSVVAVLQMPVAPTTLYRAVASAAGGAV